MLPSGIVGVMPIGFVGAIPGTFPPGNVGLPPAANTSPQDFTHALTSGSYCGPLFSKLYVSAHPVSHVSAAGAGVGEAGAERAIGGSGLGAGAGASRLLNKAKP